jgi:hypothetical protein
MKINSNTIKQKRLEDRDFVLVANEEKVYKVKKSEVVPTATNDEYQETIVNISSAQILNMGTTPVELLPAPGVDKYYDVEKIIIENIFNLVAYSTRVLKISDEAGIVAYLELSEHQGNLVTVVNPFTPPNPIPFYVDDGDGGTATANVNFIKNFDTDRRIIITALGFDLEPLDPTDGDGALRAIIKYKVRTFGE